MNNTTTGPVIGPTSFTFSGINWGRVWAIFWTTVVGAILTAVTGLVTGIDWSHVHAVIFGIDISSLIPLAVTAGWTNIANLARKFVSQNE